MAKKLYVAEQNISWGSRLIRRGSLVWLGLSPEKEAKLKSALVEVIIRLEDIPNWERRHRRFTDHGYADVQTVLSADEQALAEKLEVREATIRRWKAELLEYLEGLAAPRSG